MFRAIAGMMFVAAVVTPLGVSAISDGVQRRRAEAPQAFNDTPQRSEGGNDDWCRDAERNSYGDDDEVFCEVREFTLGGGPLSLETSNGGVRVTGEQRRDVLVRAQVVTRARTVERAREIAREVEISRDGRIRATGPRMSNREGWHVNFRIQAPQSIDLDVTSSNGSLSATDVRGRLRLRTSNGSIRLMDVAGDVQADTSNGSVTASLSGSRWEGQGLDVATSNGSVRIDLPESYNAHLVASTMNGSLNVGFPITVQGRLGGRNREIDTTLGSGGATIRLRTSNGSVNVQRR